MSRIGKLPVAVPSGVTTKLENGVFTAKGKLGELSVDVHRDLVVEIGDGEIVVKRPSESKEHRSAHGLTRTLIFSAVMGVAEGFSKTLEIVGVGYRAEMKGKDLVMHLGYSHPHTIAAGDGISFEVPEPTKVVIKGADKQKVGQVAANVRGLRPPEPYKGKGVKYEGEFIRRKAGKAAA
ncbi:MAG: 50S ribosomal protein L6 [Gemmatimonadota bacterium]|nr:MAG: 50S ribosomal protein L6 [Gemmatimonadota bacterium]